MAEIPSSSFIPRQNQSAIPARIRRRRTFSILNFVSTVILLGSLILAGGTFFYKGRVAVVQDNVKAELTAQEGLFNDTEILTVKHFDRQIRAAKHILENHIAPSKIFSVLETATMDRIQFTSFDYSYDPGFEVMVTVMGGTQEFKTVALQALAFGDESNGKEALLKDAVFTEIGTSETSVAPTDSGEEISHSVNFSLTGVIAPSEIKYDGREIPTSAFDTSLQEVVSQAQGTESYVINQDTL